MPGFILIIRQRYIRQRQLEAHDAIPAVRRGDDISMSMLVCREPRARGREFLQYVVQLRLWELHAGRGDGRVSNDPQMSVMYLLLSTRSGGVPLQDLAFAPARCPQAHFMCTRELLHIDLAIDFRSRDTGQVSHLSQWNQATRHFLLLWCPYRMSDVRANGIVFIMGKGMPRREPVPSARRRRG